MARQGQSWTPTVSRSCMAARVSLTSFELVSRLFIPFADLSLQVSSVSDGLIAIHGHRFRPDVYKNYGCYYLNEATTIIPRPPLILSLVPFLRRVRLHLHVPWSP